jgi:hypothetical protein
LKILILINYVVGHSDMLCRMLFIGLLYYCTKLCGESCFAGLTISVDGYLPQTSSQGKHKSLYFHSQISQSQSHIATDGHSVCLSWCRAPSGAHDQILLTLWQLLSCPLKDALSDESSFGSIPGIYNQFIVM